MYHVYLLKCADHSFHVGSTYDLKTAVAQHEAGTGARYTARRLPVQLVYVEDHTEPREALLREREIRELSKRECEALVTSDTNRLEPAAPR